uniref:Uncharacterized protein AlNc14C55G4202 n=1 Tax=Albugo laibachii Nc14 TaxID=890382 RepID=F0WC15_9STRA|nr:conserved hypothetical protein [Albugo laibachii Nc14]|eukprot:CCA18696.1 conserved hypothetical protein [Albugo laibachii Nc14]
MWQKNGLVERLNASTKGEEADNNKGASILSREFQDSLVMMPKKEQERENSTESEPEDTMENKNGETAKVELKAAEDKILQLEGDLLDAEEVICHLKAEKLQALRQVEKLSRQSPSRSTLTKLQNDQADLMDGNQEAEMWKEKAKMVENELSIAKQSLMAAQQQHRVECNELIEVVREQEQEISKLKTDLWKSEERIGDIEDENRLLVDLIKENTQEESRECQPELDEGSGTEEIARDMTPEWTEEWIRHPTPAFDLDSPEVQYLLYTWTSNVRKLQYIRLWLAHVVNDKVDRKKLGKISLKQLETASLEMIEPGSHFPIGVELPRLAPEVKDGFLTLIVPLLRKQLDRSIQVHSRKYNDGVHFDLRIRTLPRN